MKTSEALYAEQVIKQSIPVLVALFISLVPAHGQKYEITPLVGGMYGGTLKLDQRAVSRNFDAHLQNSLSFGIAGGFRFEDGIDECEDCDLIEFRWLRQYTHLGFKQDPLVPTPVTAPAFHPAVTLDRYLGDFTHEWTVRDAKMIKPFVTASLGAARMSTPATSATRFAFGIGTGVKIFPKRRWGIRFEVEYLPIVMHAELQRVVCSGGCVVVLNGGVMNQIELSIGPAFRF
jgi:hypothetical protein